MHFVLSELTGTPILNFFGLASHLQDFTAAGLQKKERRFKMKRVLLGIAAIMGLTLMVPKTVEAGWRRGPVVVQRYYVPPVRTYVYRPAYVVPPYWYPGVYVPPPPVVVGGWW
jgi:hypothetical protein